MLPTPKTVYQQTERDCLLACYTSVLDSLGKQVNVAQLIDYDRLNADGFSVAELRNYERDHGVDINGFWAPPEKLHKLKQLGTLLIAHQRKGHFIVLRVGSTKSYVMDPARGPMTLSNPEIAANLSGAFIQVSSRQQSSWLERLRLKIPSALQRLVATFRIQSVLVFLLGLVISQAAVILTSQIPLIVLEASHPLLPAAAVVALVLVIVSLSCFLQVKGMLGLDRGFTSRYVPKLFKGALTRPYSYYSATSASALVQKLNLRGQIRDDLLNSALPSLLGIVGSTFVGAYILWLSPFAFFGVATVYLLFLLVSWRTAALRSTTQSELASKYIDFSTAATVDIHNVAGALVRDDAAARTDDWNIREQGIRKLGMKMYALSVIESSIIMVFSVVLTVWVCVVGWYGIHESTITTGEILSIQALCVLMMGFAPSFQGLISGLSEVSAVAEKNEDLFSRPAASHLVEKTGGAAVMEVHDLNIHRGGKNLFRFPISTSIYRGDRIALIGESGIGKSSIIEALVGLSPCEGYVAIDSSIPRENIGIELPGMSLGEGSIRDFVRDLAAEDQLISDESVWEVLDIVGISEIIRSLPEGLDSKILIDGGNLSTGQGQRLRLALSLLRNPSIVFWDEGLSHLDSVSSLALLRNLNRHEKFKDLTLVAVTHDLQVCQEMDRVWSITSSGLHEIRY